MDFMIKQLHLRQNELHTDDGRVLQRTRLIVTIDAIDVATGSVTYHGSDNRRVFRVVRIASCWKA